MRTYGDRCGVARALDLVGERWALLVVRELLFGPKRFTDLRAGLPNLSPDVLSQRLRELERAGVVLRRTLAPPAGSRVYVLTERGLGLEPVILALGHWGSTAPLPPGEAGIGVDALMVALRTLFDPAASDGLSASYELRFGEQRFHARVEDGRLGLGRGAGAGEPDATIETDPGTLSTLLWHGGRPAEAQRSGALRLAGPKALVARFLKLFPLPDASPQA